MECCMACNQTATSECPTCHHRFCGVHLGPHDHTMADVPSGMLRVVGVGRVGSYDTARRSHHSRSRHHWVIGYWDNRVSGVTDLGHPMPRGVVECIDSPRFATKGEAERYLRK